MNLGEVLKEIDIRPEQVPEQDDAPHEQVPTPHEKERVPA